MKSRYLLNLLVIGLALASSAEGQSRIVNGSNCAEHQFPWMTGVFCQAWDPTKGSICTGALISSRTVLTAAHCVQGCSGFIVTLGDYNLLNNTDQEKWLSSTKGVAHEGWNATGHLENDVAVIILPEDIPQSNTVRYALLPTPGMVTDTFAGRRATIAGWGKMGNNKPLDGLCHWAADRKIMLNFICRMYEPGYINEGSICTDTSDGIGTCSGDSGGMLMLQSDEGSYYHVGVASFVHWTGCESRTPNVFARTTYYLDWILKHMEGTAIIP